MKKEKVWPFDTN